MSEITDIKNEAKLNQIPKKLETYDQIVDNSAQIFDLNNVVIGEAIKGQVTNLVIYDLMLQDCKSIEDTVRSLVEEIESELYRKLNENNGNRVLGQRDIQNYIKSEPRYIAAYDILLEVVRVKRKVESIVDALKQFGWSLNNIVKIRVANIEDAIL
jgi:hypothetical protein